MEIGVGNKCRSLHVMTSGKCWACSLLPWSITKQVKAFHIWAEPSSTLAAPEPGPEAERHIQHHRSHLGTIHILIPSGGCELPDLGTGNELKSCEWKICTLTLWAICLGLLIFIKNCFMFMNVLPACTFLCVTYVCLVLKGGQKRVSGPQRLVLQTAVSHQMVGVKPGPTSTAAQSSL